MSRKNSFTCTLNLLFFLSLQGLVLAPSPNIRQEPQDQRETSHLPEQENRVTVLVHNYAHLPAQILIEAQDRASLIFRKVGVEIEWADCPLNDEDPSLYPKCPAILDATQLFLRILSKTATKKDTGGEAFVAARIANIFWSRVEEQAQRLNVSAPRFLAHTVAHELGHLLLGSNSHSPVGIMTARWDAPTVTRLSQEGLYFNGQQSQKPKAGASLASSRTPRGRAAGPYLEVHDQLISYHSPLATCRLSLLSMTPERWQQIDKLLEQALEQEPVRRNLFLDSACAGDEQLRREVEVLLVAHDQGGSLLSTPALALPPGSQRIRCRV